MKTVKTLILFGFFCLLAACGNDGGKSTSSNVGGGFTLLASGGTINDGVGNHGLALLVTLRDDNGVGPGLNGGWQITLTGPDITLSGSYNDGSPSSYQLWRWERVNPVTGSYMVTASNGTTTLTYRFTLNATTSLLRPALTKSGSILSWGPVAGAGSYYYLVTDGTDNTVVSGYLNHDPARTSYSFRLPTLADGSYLIKVFAHAQSLPLLMSDTTAEPPLSPQENISVSQMSLVITDGTDGSYNLVAKGGVLYQGKDLANVDQYGLVIWSSILTSSNTPPAEDWTVAVTGPGITTPLTFTYPATDSHYLYWDFATPPASGNYTVTATAPGYTLTAGFVIPNPLAQLPVASNIAVTPVADSYTISWDAVPGALSYNVNLWADVDGIYTEIASDWVNGTTVSVPKVSLSGGVLYDVYVTAATLDMTTMKSLPPPNPAQVDMSDNTYGAISFLAQ